MAKRIYLDTNVFLHYQMFTQIKWQEIVDDDQLEIIVPPIIIRELNRHKDTNPVRRIRERADKILKLLNNYFSENDIYQIEDGIQILLESREPNIDYQVFHLLETVQDDQFIASILSCREEFP